MKTFRLMAQAVPSCLCDPEQARHVRAITTAVEMQAYKMGRRNRDRITVLAFRALRLQEPKFVGIQHSIGGMICGEPVEMEAK
jgi:hypothetical protein